MTLGWGIIGPGKLADIATAPAIAQHDGSTLAAVCSRSLQRAQDFARRHDGGAAYDDYDQMLADPGVDVVYISTPNAMHVDQAVAALDADKHVLLEKPMALSLESGRRLAKAAAERDGRLAVAFHLRHKESNQAARRAVLDGDLGEVFFLQVASGAGKTVFPYHTWRSDPALAGAGTVSNQGTHVLDLVRFLTGRNIVSVSTATDAVPMGEVFSAALTLEGGAIASVATHQRLPGAPRDYVVVGDGGWLDGRSTTAPVPGDQLTLRTGDDGDVAWTVESPVQAYVAEVKNFADAVEGRSEINDTVEDGLYNVAAWEAVLRSAQSGRREQVEPIW